MCGISGIYSKNENLDNILNEFNKRLANRGPDNSSIFIDKQNCFGMAHTRLSILDLSDKGNQPMYDHSGDWIISFNGEVYNHLEIRNLISDKLKEKINWRSNSDTETILVSNQFFGFEKTLQLLEGMFAFGLYNKRENILYLTRDRLGEKPLYYYHKNNKFVFGSDLSVFKSLHNIDLSINQNIINQFIQRGFIGSPFSIYKYIFKLDPGHYLKISNNFSNLIKKCYWNLKEIVKLNNFERKLNNKTFTEEKEELKKILEATIIKQKISDVQIGSFLSGGIDSSLITSILQKNSNKKIKTFTVGFKDKNFDESIQARNVSNYLGTDHNEFFYNDDDILNFVENVNDIYTEPFSDSSQIPTYLISKLMRKEAKVILSGDGGDEFYGGYNRYLYLNIIKFFSEKLPIKVKKNLYLILKVFPISFLNQILPFLNIKNFENKINKLINFINTEDASELYSKMTSLNSNFNFVTESNISKKNFFEKKEFLDDLKVQENFMIFDQIDYLPNDVLCKVDRATMFNSIESRAPFLDHKLVEQSWKIPVKYKIKKNKGKIILKEILKDYLPDKFISKDKSGFAIPIDNLLRTKLKFWAEDIFQNINKINDQINYDKIHLIWDQHKKNKVNAGGILWSILILQNWFNHNHK